MRRIILVAALLIQPLVARAAESPDAGTIRLGAAQAADLRFPAAPSAITEVQTPRMALFKPDGDGPFPALVLYHQCGGLGGGRWSNVSMLDWARKAVARGYVTLLVDALGPRDVDTVCFGPKGGVNFMRGVRDAMQGHDYIKSFSFVDPGRVALAGYSWGAMVGVLASGRQWAEALGEGRRFAAIVSMYPGCFTIRPRTAPAYDIVQPDIDRPLLVLMGGQDTETPAEDCRQKLDPLMAAGAPVETHLYPDATHCWDCSSLNGMTKMDVRGNRVSYRYDEAITRDSEERMFEFLARRMR